MSTVERLDEIKKRLESATPGPWATRAEVYDNENAYPRDVLTAWVDPELEKYGQFVICEHAGPDDEFIAHSHSDVTWLLDLVSRYQEALTSVVEMTPSPVAALQAILDRLEK